VGQFRHAKIQANSVGRRSQCAAIAEQMTLEELRDSILQDLERLRATGVLDLPQLLQGVVGKS